MKKSQSSSTISSTKFVTSSDSGSDKKKPSDEQSNAPRSTKTESSLSEQSIGFDVLSFDRVALYNQRLKDIILFAWSCAKHKKILLMKYFNTLFFPFIVIKADETVYNCLRQRIKDYCKDFGITKKTLNEPFLINLFYIQIPPKKEFVCRYTFLLEPKSAETCICAKESKNASWYLWDDVKSKQCGSLWGPEPILFYNSICTKSETYIDIYQELTMDDVCKYLHETLVKENHPMSCLLNRLQLTDVELGKLFIEYLTNTYPSLYMNKYSMEDFMSRSSLFNLCHEHERLISAFNINNEKSNVGFTYLEFDEFLFGICFMDTECPAESPYNEIRSSYLFRYYSKCKTKVDFDDLLKCCKDVEKSVFKNGMDLDKNELNKQHEKEVFTFLNGKPEVKDKNTLTFEAFAEKINSKLSKYFDLVNSWRIMKSLSYYFKGVDLLGYNLGRNHAEIANVRLENTCFDCLNKGNYWISEHTVKVNYTGTIVDTYDNDKYINNLHRATKYLRTYSRSFFTADYLPNKLSDIITEQFKVEAEEKTSSTKNCVKKNFKEIKGLCTEVKQLLTNEVIAFKSPCILITEFDGKFNELKSIMTNLSHIVSVCFPIRYIYLMNWGDIQRCGLFFLIHWITLKVLMPTKYHIVMGKYDTKSKKETESWLSTKCENFLGKEQGSELCYLLLAILQNVPKMVVIDDSVSVVCGVESNDDLYTNLDCILSTKIKAKQSNPNVRRSSLLNFPSKSVSGKNYKWTVFCTNEQVEKKLVYLKSPETTGKAGLIPLGESKNKDKAKQKSLVLLELDKIRIIYITFKKKKK